MNKDCENSNKTLTSMTRVLHRGKQTNERFPSFGLKQGAGSKMREKKKCK